MEAEYPGYSWEGLEAGTKLIVERDARRDLDGDDIQVFRIP